MLDVGRMCMKIAGRDAGNSCVIVDVIDNTFVLIDGNVRRKRCNIAHLEPMREVLDIKKGASHEDIVALFKQRGIFAAPAATKQYPRKSASAGAKAGAAGTAAASAPSKAPKSKATTVKAKKEPASASAKSSQKPSKKSSEA